MNVLDIANSAIHRKFTHSRFWLSKKRLYDIYEFNSILDKVNLDFSKITHLSSSFF
jgi:hypothetical protein